MKILIADDERIIRKIVEDVISDMGFDHISVADGDAALKEMQKENSPELAIIDWVMPKMEGVDLCREIRKIENAVPPYLIMLTGKKITKADLVEGLDIGADDYLIKPFDVDEFKARINVGVRIIKLEQELNRHRVDLEKLVDQKTKELIHTKNEIELHRDHLKEMVEIRTGELSDSEKQYRSLVENAHDLIWKTDTKGFFTFFNPNGLETLGLDQTAIGTDSANYVYSEDIPKVREAFLNVIKNKSPEIMELRVNKKNGEILTLHQRMIPLIENDEVVEVLAFGLDITDRKKAEEAVLKARKYAENITMSMTDALFVVNTNAEIQTVNPAAATLLDYTEKELIGLPIGRLFAAASEEEELYAILKLKREFIEKANIGFIHIDVNGQIKKANQWLVNALGSPSEEATKQINVLKFPLLIEAGISGDVQSCLEKGVPIETERKYTSKFGVEILLNLHAYPNKNKDGNVIALTGLIYDGKMENPPDVNYWEDFLLDMNFGKLFAEEEEEEEEVFHNRERILKRKDGSTLPVLMSGAVMKEQAPPVLGIGYSALGKTPNIQYQMPNTVHEAKRSEQITGIVLVAKDITELKKAEEELKLHRDHLESLVEVRTKEIQEKDAQLTHSGRLAALGEMATGVAHELNQPLSVIRAEAQGLQWGQQYEDEIDIGEWNKTLVKVINQVDRASRIINNMRSFARTSLGELDNIHLEGPVEAGLEFFNEKCRIHEVILTKKFAKNIPVVLADEQKVQQIIVNLVSNAFYAVEKRAESSDRKYKKKITIQLKKDKKHVYLEVHDNGIGMSIEKKSKFMDPFYTTKPVGEGTGLGMNIVNTIVKEFDANLVAESEEGGGTVIRIKFKKHKD